MTTTFKELPISARFTTPDEDKIVLARGDRPSPDFLGYKHYLIKRDSLGGHVLYATYGFRYVSSVYYRIEPDTVVETI